MKLMNTSYYQQDWYQKNIVNVGENCFQIIRIRPIKLRRIENAGVIRENNNKCQEIWKENIGVCHVRSLIKKQIFIRTIISFYISLNIRGGISKSSTIAIFRVSLVLQTDVVSSAIRIFKTCTEVGVDES